jgi:hypothetical protein
MAIAQEILPNRRLSPPGGIAPNAYTLRLLQKPIVLRGRAWLIPEELAKSYDLCLHRGNKRKRLWRVCRIRVRQVYYGNPPSIDLVH